ncbi:MAG: Ppx/GppA phosphatase family protein [Balneolaceae bacterium]|nr:Ppx/GppA phosphatase family protein [Balneolaceae bacterium]
MNNGTPAASIDIGTNSVLLLVAETDGNIIDVQTEKQEIPRLGRGVDKNRALHDESIRRVLDVLQSYKVFLRSNYPDLADHVVVTATSAVRDASNRSEFMSLVEKETGWKVSLLSGNEEAQYTYKGATSVLSKTDRVRCVLDIGGGSTEIAFGKDSVLLSHISLDIGSVRFTERYLLSSPPRPEEIRHAENAVREELKKVEVPEILEKPEAVGVAGTVTSVAAIEAGHESYLPEKLNGYRLSIESVNRFVQRFSTMTAEEIEQDYPIFLKGRGDVILGGLIILREFLNWMELDSITVSTGGIRHGAILEKITNK